MARGMLHFEDPAHPSRLSVATEKLSHLQTEFISEALGRAVDDVSAAIAHQLSEPLTALLYHLHDMKQRRDAGEGTETVPESLRQIIDVALREMGRVCDIVERMDRTAEPPVAAETAVTRGYQAIGAWSQNRKAVNTGRKLPPAASAASQPVLTPREREVLALIVGGASNKEGGHRLRISTRTFEAHRAHLMAKVRAKNAAHLVSMALSESFGPG